MPPTPDQPAPSLRRRSADIRQAHARATATPDAPHDLPIAHIRRDGGTQARTGTNEEAVAAYTIEMQEARWRWHPGNYLVVFRDPAGILWLADGFHRLEAAQRAGSLSVPCDVRPGGQRDAVLHACGSNANHGLRRSRDDVRHAIAILVRDPEWGQWSDREIARRIGCSPQTVTTVRRELVVSAQIEQIDRRTVTRNGTIYTQAERSAPPRDGTPTANEPPTQALVPPEFDVQQQRVATAGGSLTHNGDVFVLIAPDGTVSEHRTWLSVLNRLWAFARPGDGEATATIHDAQAGERHAIAILVRDPEWGQWSDHDLARRVGCSPQTVEAVRRELVVSAHVEQIDGRPVTPNGTTDPHAERSRPVGGADQTGAAVRNDPALSAHVEQIAERPVTPNGTIDPHAERSHPVGGADQTVEAVRRELVVSAQIEQIAERPVTPNGTIDPHAERRELPRDGASTANEPPTQPPLPPEFSLHHQRVATAGGSLTHNGEVFVLVAPDGTVSEHRMWLSVLNRLWAFARPGDGEATATIRDAPAGATCPALEADEARAARAALEADEADEARDVHEALDADETRAVHEAWAACADAAPDELDDDPEADAWMPAPPEAAEPHAPPPPPEPPHDRNAITVAVEHALAEALHAARPRLVRIIGAVLTSSRDEVDAPAAPLVGAALQDALLTRLRRWSDATLAWALNDPPPDDRPTLASSIARTDADVHLADQMGNVRRAA